MFGQPTDMRKGFDGLSGLIINKLGKNPIDGSVYIFINRRRDRMKLLVWQSYGFVLYYKRLESGTFEITWSLENELSIEWETLMLIIQGVSIENIKRRKRYKRA